MVEIMQNLRGSLSLLAEVCIEGNGVKITIQEGRSKAREK